MWPRKQRFFNLPLEGSWALIKDIQRKYKTVVVAADRASAEVEARGRVSRLKAKAAAHVAHFMNRVGNRHKNMKIIPRSRWPGWQPSARASPSRAASRLYAARSAHAFACARSRRLRCLQSAAKTWPTSGRGSWRGLKTIAALPLPRSPPLCFPTQPAQPTLPLQPKPPLYMQHMGRISDAIEQLKHLTSAGSKANLFQRSRHPIREPSTPALFHAPPVHQAHRAPTTPQLSSRFD